jgi:3-methyl-2-oxobutanoate hydroxymethyltransferase
MLARAGDRLLEDALALHEAGAFAVVPKAIPAELGTGVSEALSIPTVGIGAGGGATPRSWCGRTSRG